MPVFPDPPDPSFQEEIPFFSGFSRATHDHIFPLSGTPLWAHSQTCSQESDSRLKPTPASPSLLPPTARLQLGEYQTVVQVNRGYEAPFLVAEWDGSGIETLDCPIAKEGLCHPGEGRWAGGPGFSGSVISWRSASLACRFELGQGFIPRDMENHCNETVS